MRDEWSIGIDIGGTKTEVAHVDPQGRVVARKKFPTPVKEESGALIALLVDVVEELRQESNVPPAAVGVGIAGQVVAATGVVAFAPNLPHWRNVPLQAALQEALRLPASVTNDVRAATWAEWQHGAGKGHRDLVCIFIGTGIGGGIVSGGEMLTGATNCAGELGHMIVQMGGPTCKCGNRGCLEALASGWALARAAQQALRDAPGEGDTLSKAVQGDLAALTARQVIESAVAGDALSLRLIDASLEALTAGCVGIVNAFNPARLILGGGLGHALPQMVERVSAGVRASSLKAATASLDIVPAFLLNEAGVVGAATLALQKLGR